MSDFSAKLDTKTTLKIVLLAFVDAVTPYIKRVVMLLAFLVALRNYLNIVASTDHNSQDMLDAIGMVFFTLLIFLVVLPFLEFLSFKLQAQISKVIKSRFPKKQSKIVNLTYVTKRKRLAFAFSFVMAILILSLFASTLAAFVLVIAQILNLIYIWAFSARLVPKKFRSEFFKFEMVNYFGFAIYVVLLCVGYYYLDGQFAIDISHIFLFIMVPRTLIRAQKNALKTIKFAA